MTITVVVAAPGSGLAEERSRPRVIANSATEKPRVGAVLDPMGAEFDDLGVNLNAEEGGRIDLFLPDRHSLTFDVRRALFELSYAGGVG